MEGAELRTLSNNGEVSRIIFSSDGGTIAVVNRGSTEATAGAIKLWNTDGKALKTIPFEGFLRNIYISDNGQTVVTVDRDNTVKLWETDKEDSKIMPSSAHAVLDVSLSPDGELIAIAR
jgi:WD40 repeat protein